MRTQNSCTQKLEAMASNGKDEYSSDWIHRNSFLSITCWNTKYIRLKLLFFDAWEYSQIFLVSRRFLRLTVCALNFISVCSHLHEFRLSKRHEIFYYISSDSKQVEYKMKQRIMAQRSHRPKTKINYWA